MCKKKSIQVSIFIIALIFCFGLFFLLVNLLETRSFLETDEISSNCVDTSSIDSEVESLNPSENYSYCELPIEFDLKNTFGNIEITENHILLTFEGMIVEIPQFKYYRIKDKKGNTRYFQADTYLEGLQDSPFALIAIYLPSYDYDANVYTMIIQYGDADLRILYNVKLSLKSFEVEYFESIAIDWILGTDEISTRLKASVRVQDKGKGLTNRLNVDSHQSFNSIHPSFYDSYTDNDGIIHSYVDSHFGNYQVNGFITDDPIVQIIPKNLFFIPGEHLYVGKEYGFFVNTIHTNAGDRYADVFVFDILHILPKFPNYTTGFSRVTPLFQYRYRTYDNTESAEGFDPSLTSIVYPHIHYDAAEYFINNIGFKHSLANPTLLNPGDTGYKAEEDDGAFIIQTRYNARGVGLKKKDGNFTKDILLFGFGFIPYVGSILSVGEFAVSLYDGFGNQGYFYSRDTWVEDNEANIETYQTNNTDQIRVHNNLIKSVSSRLVPDINNPRIIHVGGGYAESKYVVARRSNSNYDKMNVVTSISVNIVEDNTSRYWSFGWKEQGEIQEYGSATGTYETSNYEHAGDVTSDVTKFGYISKNIEAGFPHQIFRFVPTINSSYLIRGHGVQSPDVIIHDATLNQSTDAFYRHTLDLLAGRVYYIEYIETEYFYECEYTVHIGYNPETANEIKINTEQTVSLRPNDCALFHFSPTSSGIFDIFTTNTLGDPYLILLDENGVHLTYDDDGNGNLDARISYKMKAGQKYYIIVLGYDGTSTEFKINVISGYPKLILNQLTEVIMYGPPVTYVFVPEVTGVYYICTDFSENSEVANGNYACLWLYDSNFSLIEYNEYGKGIAYHAAITATLEAGQRYYISAGNANYVFSIYGLKIKLL